MQDVKGILEEWLTNNGFDGLYLDSECACKLDDLCYCDAPQVRCEPGYLVEMTCEEHLFHIAGEKTDVIDVCSGS